MKNAAEVNLKIIKIDGLGVIQMVKHTDGSWAKAVHPFCFYLNNFLK